jgi:hypothetical protein
MRAKNFFGPSTVQENFKTNLKNSKKQGDYKRDKDDFIFKKSPNRLQKSPKM